jgi:hypothetical protein
MQISAFCYHEAVTAADAAHSSFWFFCRSYFFKNQKKYKKTTKIQKIPKKYTIIYPVCLGYSKMLVDAIQLFYFVLCFLRNCLIHKHNHIKQFLKPIKKTKKTPNYKQ